VRGFQLALAAAALGGCAGTSIVHSSYYNSAYTPSHVTLAAASGPSLAVIRSNPFPADRDNAGVLAAMQGRNFGPKMFFTQTPRPDDRYGYKVVLDFGSGSARYASQCTAPPTPPAAAAAAGPIAVTASFCVGEVLLTDASGSIGGARGPDDPVFRRLIGDLLVALTPPYDPNRRGDDWLF
jgi:hypothetical protein